MYGAILGDMIGAPYEFDRGNKTKDFPLFSRGSQFTDDSVMTIAVAEALMSLKGEADDEAVHHAVSKAMRIWGRNYPDAGYGGRFRDWLFTHWQPKPWGQSFMLAKELIEMIFKADGDVEYSVPDDPITPELLEDGTFLKRATEICNRNRTQLNLIKLARILRDSWVWVPCTAIFSEADTEAMNKVVLEAADNNDLDSLVGHTFTSHDEVRMVPDILQNGDDFFFPVFSSDQEMGEYGQQFSKVQRHFLEAANLARNNEKNVKGIVINAFSEPFVIPKELFDVIAGMKSSIEREVPDNE